MMNKSLVNSQTIKLKPNYHLHDNIYSNPFIMILILGMLFILYYIKIDIKTQKAYYKKITQNNLKIQKTMLMNSILPNK